LLSNLLAPSFTWHGDGGVRKLLQETFGGFRMICSNARRSWTFQQGPALHLLGRGDAQRIEAAGKNARRQQ
jgi:hypothetical protein